MSSKEAYLMEDVVKCDVNMSESHPVTEALLRHIKDCMMGIVVFSYYDARAKHPSWVAVNSLEKMNLVRKFSLEMDYKTKLLKIRFNGKIVLKLPKEPRSKKIGKKKK